MTKTRKVYKRKSKIKRSKNYRRSKRTTRIKKVKRKTKKRKSKRTLKTNYRKTLRRQYKRQRGASREPVVARYDSTVPETFMSEHVIKPNPFKGWTAEEREAHRADRMKRNADAKAQSPEGIAQAEKQKQITRDRQEEEDILEEARGIAEAGYNERMAYIMAGSPDATGNPRETDPAIMVREADKFSTEHNPELLDRENLGHTMDIIRQKRQLAAKKATKASKLGGSPK
jgi:hypothetical protein